MADVTQTVALLVLAQNYRGNVVRQINRRSALLKLLPLVQGEGKNCAWSVQGSGQIGENYTEGADASNFGSDEQVEALLSWGHYRANFHVSGTARRTAATSRSPMGVQNLVGRNMQDALTRLVSVCNAALFTGAGTGTTIAGLDVAVADNTNTYAGIDRTTKTYFKPYVIDPGAPTNISFAQIRTDLGAIYNASGEQPDIAICSTAVFNQVVDLFDENRRWIQDVTTARGAVKLDAGYGGVEVDGCVFIRDKDATEGQIYYLNTSHVHIEYLPLEASIMEALGEMGLLLSADDGYGSWPLGILVHALAKNGDSDRYEALTNLQLVVDRPNSCGARLNVATA